MSFREKFKQKKALLSRQQTNQIQSKGSFGLFPSIVRKDLLPAGVQLWRPGVGEHLIDILPWYAGPNFPVNINSGIQDVKEGDPVYVLELQVHRGIGPLKTPFVCPRHNFKKPCVIDSFLDDNHVDKEDWKKIRAMAMTYYLIWCHDTREEENKGVQLWEVSRFVMEDNLNVISKLPRGGGVIPFSDPEDGQSIAFTKEGKGSGNVKWLGHRFVPRDAPLPEKLLDMTFPIDTVLTLHPDPKEFEEAFMGQRASLSLEGDVENAGSGFSSAGNDAPSFMDNSPEYEEKKDVPAQRKKFVLKKKPQSFNTYPDTGEDVPF
jgi:hypothetical protein